MADGGKAPPPSIPTATPAPPPLPKGGLVSRVWKGIFGGREDVEKLLKSLSKEEEVLRSRIHHRARASRQSAHNVIALAAALEIVAVGYAIMTTRPPDLSWQMRAARVLPIFLVPALAALIHSIITNFTKMLESRDQYTLEKLRSRRQAKIDELKERTNYYTTQQLIQRYDLDPAAKAAAASVLASKLGADSGLKIYLGDESNREATWHKSNDQHGHTAGLRQRKPAHSGNGTGRVHDSEPSDGSVVYDGSGGPTSPNQRTVEHIKSPAGNDGGWLARLAALLVGEDPTQCFALICGNCHMHNGLARKEDFSFITYYCPHCNALNGSRQHEDNGIIHTSGKETPTSHFDGSIGQGGASLASSNVTSHVARNLRTGEELPAENPIASNSLTDLPTVEELPAENVRNHVAKNLRTTEEPAGTPIASDLLTDELSAGSPVASNVETVEEHPAEVAAS